MCDAVLALLLLQANSDTEIDHTLDDVYISGSSGKAIFAVRSVANGRLRSNPSFPQRPIMGWEADVRQFSVPTRLRRLRSDRW